MICAAVERCAGIDVGKKWLSVCTMIGPLNGEPRVERQRFGVNVADLQRLRDWLVKEAVSGQSARGEEPEGPQDRRQRWVVAGAFTAPRYDSSQFHTASPDTRTVRPDPAAVTAAWDGHGGKESSAEDP